MSNTQTALKQLQSLTNEQLDVYLSTQTPALAQQIRQLLATHQPVDTEGEVIEEQSNIFGDSNLNIYTKSGFPGSGKTHSTLREMLDYQGLTVYVVHDRNSIDGTDSRKADLLALEDERGGEILRKFYVYSSTNDEARDTITRQFTMACEAIEPTEKAVIFITHKALEILQFDKLPEMNCQLIIDEVPQALKIMNRPMFHRDITTLLNSVDHSIEEHDDQYVIKLTAANFNGQSLLLDESNKVKSSTKDLFHQIKHIDNTKDDCFLVLKKFTDEGACQVNGMSIDADGEPEAFRMSLKMVTPSAQFVDLINPTRFSEFNRVSLLGDDAENSILMLMLTRNRGVTMELESLPPRVSSIMANINKIYYITDHTYSSERAKNVGVYNDVAVKCREILGDGDTLWLTNNSAHQDEAFADTIKGRFNDVLHSPATHGKNGWMGMTNVVMMYSTKGKPVEVAMLRRLGIDDTEQRRWTEFNTHIQNAQRCWLRSDPAEGFVMPEGSGNLVFPDKAGAEFYAMRVQELFGEDISDRMELLDQTISDKLAPNKPGRAIVEENPLNAAQRNKLSKWRKEMPRIGDWILDVYEGNRATPLDTLKVKAVREAYATWISTQPESWSFEHLDEWIECLNATHNSNLPDGAINHATLMERGREVCEIAYANWLRSSHHAFTV